MIALGRALGRLNDRLIVPLCLGMGLAIITTPLFG